MEYLPDGLTLELSPGGFPLSTDSMALAHFTRLPKNARVLDFGSGSGTLGLLLCAKNQSCTVVGMELNEDAHAAALENIRRNGLQARMESICADLRSVSARFSPGAFSVCISNPPYFSGGPQSRNAPLARREDSCPLPELFKAAAWALKYGGDFYLVHRRERMAELMALGHEHGLEAKELCLLRHIDGGPVTLILLRFKKGAKPGLSWQEWSLHRADGSESDLYRAIYHTDI